MGGGDVKLMAAAGLYLGWKLILFSLFAGSVTGAAAGMILIVKKRAGLKSEIPFGPFLAFGAAAAALYGDLIVSWYGGLFL
jgi:prepilin signal peptidase PulO-like enzyme (type II secretory pathway)